jgi:peptidoglycan hydrolase CwlO-like protein
MGIFSEALAEMDSNTVDYMIDEMQKKNDQLQQENAQLQSEIEQLKQKLYDLQNQSADHSQ